jgi:ABC-type multidrug transport system fused ATPase/permease subunit
LFLAITPLVGIVAIGYGRVIQPRTVRQLDALNRCSATASDCFHNLRLVKLFNMEGEEIHRFEHANHDYYRVLVHNYTLGTLTMNGSISCASVAAFHSPLVCVVVCWKRRSQQFRQNVFHASGSRRVALVCLSNALLISTLSFRG